MHFFFPIEFNIAIIINNDTEKVPDDKKTSLPPVCIRSQQSDQLHEKLHKLGYCVLYFSNLAHDVIPHLLKILSEGNYSSVASIHVIFLSKGADNKLYDQDGAVIPFGDIFQWFNKDSLSDIPKIFFFHTTHTSNTVCKSHDIPKNSAAFYASHKQKKSAKDLYPAIAIYEEEMASVCSTPIKVFYQKMENKIKSSKSDTQCTFYNTLEEEFIFPACSLSNEM